METNMKALSMIILAALLGAVGCAGTMAVGGSENRKLQTEQIDVRVYKTIDGRDLRLHVFYPAGYSAAGPTNYPVAVSIHGGGWTTGPIEWGDGDAKFMTTLGFVGVAVEYRLANRTSVSALDCLKDANSAVRWIRRHAKELNIDPARVLTIGHSAGGHLSIATAMFPAIREAGEDQEISSVPNAVVALAPPVELTKDGYFQGLLLGTAQAVECSPLENVRNLNIPILVIHGSGDWIVPAAYSEEFVRKMKAAGNNIELKIIPNGSHNTFYDNPEGIRFWKEAARNFVKDF
jgi:acetyl esterase